MFDLALTYPEPVALGAALALLLIALVLLAVLVCRNPSGRIEALRHTLAELAERLDRLAAALHEESARSRQEAAVAARQAREESLSGAARQTEALLARLGEAARSQKDQLDSFARQLASLTGLNEAKLESLRATVEDRLRGMQADTGAQLDRMRRVVDDTLQSTLEKRLGESFRQVSERLELVYAGLGEMRALASGVGDLKKVLTNVKNRGIWGEVRLAQLLDQILAPEQYAANVATRPGSGERVEFAIRLPGPDPSREAVVWLPIDAKFPQEDYQRLLDAQEAADKEQAERSLRSLEARVKAEARAVRDKYLEPPHTTDFALLFLPVEGLYAEVLRIPGLCDHLQRDCRVVVAGPTTLAALLNSLQMGFRTLAIERRSSEVWELLSVVKTEFGRFGDTLSRTKKKLQEAASTIDQAEVRTRAIERRLRRVAEAPPDTPLAEGLDERHIG
ncbi:MAG: DNA recombination protein RmuC [Desulfobacterales bacterium]|nr:DNA recombination protein RmuC [Desulfobacterales bacterium]